MVYAGANPIKFVKQYRDQGLGLPLLGGSTVADDSIMRNFGDEAIGLINSIPYTLDLDTDANHRFIASMQKYYGADVPIGFYAAALYVDGQILEAALQATGGDTDPDKLIAAIKKVSLTDTPRGPVKFDDYGNLTFTVYIRKVEKKDGKLVNTTVKSLSGREPVLALRSEEIPRPAGIFARFPAAEDLKRSGTKKQRRQGEPDDPNPNLRSAGYRAPDGAGRHGVGNVAGTCVGRVQRRRPRRTGLPSPDARADRRTHRQHPAADQQTVRARTFCCSIRARTASRPRSNCGRR